MPCTTRRTGDRSTLALRPDSTRESGHELLEERHAVDRPGDHPARQKAIEADGRYAQTSIWVEVQRRWVWLKGCVRSEAEAKELEKLVRSIDDVELVINELVAKEK